MTSQKIIESLLRARLYRRVVLLQLRTGRRLRLRIEDVRYEGRRARVVVARPEKRRAPWSIELGDVLAVDCLDLEPEAA